MHKPQGQLQEWSVPFGTHFKYPYNFRVNFETLRYTKRSNADHCTLPLGPLSGHVLKGLEPSYHQLHDENQSVHHQFLPSRKVAGIGTCPPIQLKQNPAMAPLPFFWLENCLCSNWLTIWLQCCTRKLQFSLLTDWESSPLPTQTCSNLSSSLYNSFNAHSQL